MSANCARRHRTKVDIAVRTLRALGWKPDDGRPGQAVKPEVTSVSASPRSLHWSDAPSAGYAKAKNLLRDEARLPAATEDWPEGSL